MNLELKKELPLIAIVLAPFVYLAFVWKSLPEKVPMHWNYKGEIDSWGGKYSLIVLLFSLTVFVYLIMLIVPKKRLSIMGGKLYQLRFVLVLFFSCISFVIVYLSKYQSMTNPGLIYIPLGILFVALGNYFKVIQPNYFIGIKTPWTLESKEVWKLTHSFAGKLWMIGGVIIIISSLTVANEYNKYIMIGTTVLILILPIVFSYFKFKELQK